jgi:hypothetical protein
VQSFGPKQEQESHVNILSETDEDHPEDVTFRNYRTFRQIALVLKGLGPETYKCLQDREALPDPTEGSAATEGSPVPMILDESDDAMDVDDPDDASDDVQSDDAMVDVEESADRVDEVAVQGAVECPFLVEDEADELGGMSLGLERYHFLKNCELTTFNTCITSKKSISPAF